MAPPPRFGLSRRALLASLPALACLPALGEARGRVGLCVDDALADYGFPPPHPFSRDRQAAFLREARARGLLERVRRLPSRLASDEELVRFHTAAHIARVKTAAEAGLAALDDGDTPVFAGLHAAAARVVGTALEACARIVAGEIDMSLQPIGGLHHARRERAAGFCVYDDCGVVIETLRRVHGVRRIAYVDIDAHHGDGVFYGFEADPELIFADIHQDSRTLFPGTGLASETGKGAAGGTKLNLELPPGAGDEAFRAAFTRVEAHLEAHAPEFILFQCGADGLAGDPLAQLALSPAAHRHAAARLRRAAERHAGGRLMAFGGGGYAAANFAPAWCEVLAALLAARTR
ncbi:MAG TPA: acetoin utilization protein AcuC [Gammaproteobacteria bacterium]|nr:acetoin utilization protein AcuC [Gammaproteobacteria bacterium]